MDTTEQSPTVLSLCPGMLGLERGLERAIGRVRIVNYVEIEAFAIENLVSQMEQGVLAPTPIWSNVKTFLPIARKLRGKVDIITGGYPCPPFSNAGKQRGTADPRHLFPYIDDIINAVRPICIFLENVSNHLNIGYRQVRSSLEKLGYKIEEGIFSAEEVGAPHIRKRLFILAIRQQLGNTNCNVSTDLGRDIAEMCDVSKEERESKYSATLPRGASKALDVANSNSTRLEGGFRSGHREGTTRSRRMSPSGDSFPMGQGCKQYDWEEPRMLESSMGLTVNGYNYREDLLRMAGNAVVEQTAELAFRTLYRKFLL